MPSFSRMNLCLPLLVLLLLAASFSSQRAEGSFLDDIDFRDAGGDDSCVAKDTSVVASVNSNFINRAIAAFLPQMELELKNFTIPPQEIPHGTTGDILVENFYMEHVYVSFADPTPDQFTIQVKELSFTIDDSNFTVTSGITCPGVFWGEFKDTDVNISLQTGLSEDNQFVTEVRNTSFAWGPISLHHKVTGKMCNMAESVVSVFLGDLDELVETSVKEELPHQLPPIFDEHIKMFLSSLPFPVSGGPFMDGETVSFEMQLVRPDRVEPISPGSHVTYLRKSKDMAMTKDMGIVIPEKSVQNRVDYSHCQGRLGLRTMIPSQWNSELFRNVIPDMYHMCTNCLLEVEILSEKSWNVMFNHETVDLTVVGIKVGLFMVTETAQQARKIHEYIMSGEDELPKGRAWRTPDFTSSIPMEANTKIPIAQVRLSGRLEATEVFMLSLFETKLHYSLEILDDVDVEVVEMNVNGINARDLRRAVLGALNFGMIIRANKMSPIELPQYFVDTELTINQDFLSVESNVKLSKFLEHVDNVTKRLNSNTSEAEQQEEFIEETE